MMHKSKNKFKNFNKLCCLLTHEGPAVASSDPTESSLTNNTFSVCSDDRKVDVIPLLRAIEKGKFILWLQWNLEKSVTLSNRTM